MLIYVFLAAYLAAGLGTIETAQRLTEGRVPRDLVEHILLVLLWPCLVGVVMIALFLNWRDRMKYGTLPNN